MNTYEDFKHYIKEQEELINILKSNKLHTFTLIDKPLNVVNYFADKAIDGVKLDADEQEVFELGYSYLNDVISLFKNIYENYLNKDVILVNKYDVAILYQLLLSDLEAFLECEELLDDKRKKELDELNSYIINIYTVNKEINEETQDYINDFFESLTPSNDEFIPTYTIFIEIADGYKI